MRLYARPISEKILPREYFAQVLGNCVHVFIPRPSYSAQTDFERAVRGSCCVSVVVSGLDTREHLTRNCCANIIGSLPVSA